MAMFRAAKEALSKYVIGRPQMCAFSLKTRARFNLKHQPYFFDINVRDTTKVSKLRRLALAELCKQTGTDVSLARPILVAGAGMYYEDDNGMPFSTAENREVLEAEPLIFSTQTIEEEVEDFPIPEDLEAYREEVRRYAIEQEKLANGTFF